jgi:hypothetical protein
LSLVRAVQAECPATGLSVSSGRCHRHAIRNHFSEEKTMSVGTILLVVLILILIGVFPTWPHSRNWGYGPTGGLGLVVIILVVLLLLGLL